MRILIIIGCLFLASCSTFKTIETRIPVLAKRPEIPNDPLPELPIKSLTKDSSAPDVMKAYVKSLVILKRDNEKLRTMIESQN